jgi:hypothetical protein
MLSFRIEKISSVDRNRETEKCRRDRIALTIEESQYSERGRAECERRRDRAKLESSYWARTYPESRIPDSTETIYRGYSIYSYGLFIFLWKYPCTRGYSDTGFDECIGDIIIYTEGIRIRWWEDISRCRLRYESYLYGF